MISLNFSRIGFSAGLRKNKILKLLFYLNLLFLYGCMSIGSKSSLDLINGNEFTTLIDNLQPKLDVNERSESGVTPLILATQKKNNDLAFFLLTHGARVDDQDSLGNTALHYAIQLQEFKLAAILLEKGANPVIRNKKGVMPLILSLQLGDLFLNQKVFNSKNVNAVLDTGDYPIHVATALKNKKLVDYLLSQGALPNVKNSQQLLPLDIALGFKDSEEYADLAILLLDSGSLAPKDDNFTYLYTAHQNNNYSYVFPNGNTPLIEAAFKGHLGIFQKLLEKDVPINVQNEGGVTALHAASSSGNYEMVQLLVGEKVNIDPVDKNGNTPLMVAVITRQFKNIVLYLIDSKASLTAKNNQKNGLIHLSILNDGTADNIAQLIDLGAPVTERNAYGRTPLLESLIRERYEITRLLQKFDTSYFSVSSDKWDHPGIKDVLGVSPATFALEKGRTVSSWFFPENVKKIKDDYGNSLLHFAVLLDSSEELLKLLLDRKNEINELNGEGNTPLHLAVKNSLLEQAIFLEKENANIFISNNSGQTPLGLIFNNGELFSDSFLAATTIVNKKNNFNETPLFYAIRENKNPNIIRLLLSYGANPNVFNSNGFSLFHLAIDYSYNKATSILVEGGGQLEIKDFDGNTPFLYLISEQHSNLIPFYLSLGSNINAQNKNGYTALHLATINSDLESISSLIEFGADAETVSRLQQTPLFLAIADNKLRVANYLLLVAPQTLIVRDSLGNTPLHAAVLNQNLDAVKTLLPLSNPFDINGRSESSISFAMKIANVKVLNYLLEDRINQTDTLGNTPLHIAVLNGVKPEIIYNLLDAGALPTIKNGQNKTAVDLARDENKQDLLAALESL